MERTAFLQMRNIRKAFGHLVALDNVDFPVDKGGIHGLLGENGAGKTTLMNILFGLYKPDQGDILFEGKKSPSDLLMMQYGSV